MIKLKGFYDRVFTCLHNSSLRLNRHFFLIPLRWRIRQILLYQKNVTKPTKIITNNKSSGNFPRSDWNISVTGVAMHWSAVKSWYHSNFVQHRGVRLHYIFNKCYEIKQSLGHTIFALLWPIKCIFSPKPIPFIFQSTLPRQRVNLRKRLTGKQYLLRRMHRCLGESPVPITSHRLL